jgi:hypothetical protein
VGCHLPRRLAVNSTLPLVLNLPLTLNLVLSLNLNLALNLPLNPSPSLLETVGRTSPGGYRFTG